MFMNVIILRIFEDFSFNAPSKKKFRRKNKADIVHAIQILL
jgi:hypothetical protein